MCHSGYQTSAPPLGGWGACATNQGACTFNNIDVNGQEDKRQGKVVLDQFYANIAGKNFDKNDKLCSDTLAKLASPDVISKMEKFIQTKMGNYKSHVINDQYIRRVSGTNNQTTYNYKLKVTYDKGVVDEVIGFYKQDNSPIKIVSYHANSDLLMK